MADKSVRIRMEMQGGKVVEAELQSIGNKGAAAMGKVTAATSGVGDGMGRMGSAVQNASYQLADVIVQVDGGVDVFRALSQQLPQLLAGLGVFGAVAGVAAAALSPLIRMMMDGQDPMKAFTEDLKALEGAVSALRGADKAAGADVMDLVGQYGAYADKAREILELQRQSAEMRANQAFNKAAASAAEVFGVGLSAKELQETSAAYDAFLAKAKEFDARVTDASASGNWEWIIDIAVSMQQAGIEIDQNIASLIAYKQGLIGLSDSFGVLEQDALRMALAAAQLGEAENTSDRVELAAALSKLIWETSDGLLRSKEEARALYDELNLSALSGLTLEQLEIASGIGAGADEADRLAGNMRDAANAWLEARSLSQTPGNLALEKYGSRGADVGAGMPVIGVDGKPYSPPKVSTGGVGRGGGRNSDVDRMAQEVLRLNEAFSAGSGPAAKYQAAVAKLDELKGKGLSDGAYAEGLRKLNIELANSSPFANLADSAIDALVKGEDALSALENGFKSMLANIAKEIVKAQLGKLLANSIGGGGNMLGSVLGGVSGGGGNIVGTLLGGASTGGLFAGAATGSMGLPFAAGSGGVLAALGPVGIAVGIGALLFGGGAKRRAEEEARRREEEARQREAAAREAQETLQEKLGLEAQILQLQGDTTTLRAQELEKLRPANRELQERIWALEKEAQISAEASGLREQLLRLQGDEAELRRLALEKLDPANRALQEQVWAMEDAEKASQKLTSALGNLSEQNFASALDFARARGALASGLRVVAGTSITPAATLAATIDPARTDGLLTNINTSLSLMWRKMERWDVDGLPTVAA